MKKQGIYSPDSVLGMRHHREWESCGVRKGLLLIQALISSHGDSGHIVYISETVISDEIGCVQGGMPVDCLHL